MTSAFIIKYSKEFNLKPRESSTIKVDLEEIGGSYKESNYEILPRRTPGGERDIIRIEIKNYDGDYKKMLRELKIRLGKK